MFGEEDEENVPDPDQVAFERNEAKAKDMDILLYKLETKVEILEQVFQNYSVNLTKQLAQDVSRKIDGNPYEFIPNTYKTIRELAVLKEQIDMGMGLDLGQNKYKEETKKDSGIDADEFKRLTFTCNTLKKELDWLKKQFTPKKLQALDSLE